jgi:hypothetical protein
VNGFFCWLTGGHRYAHSNQIVDFSPDSNEVWLSNHCIKCGTRYFKVMDAECFTPENVKRSDNNGE